MACPNFMKKTFAGGSKTVKIVKVFSLKSFPLFGNINTILTVSTPRIPDDMDKYSSVLLISASSSSVSAEMTYNNFVGMFSIRYKL